MAAIDELRKQHEDLRERVTRMEVTVNSIEASVKVMAMKQDSILTILNQAKGWRGALLFFFGGAGLFATILALFESVREFVANLFT